MPSTSGDSAARRRRPPRRSASCCRRRRSCSPASGRAARRPSRRVADVLDRDRVAQRLAGEQHVRVARQVRRDLLHDEARAPRRCGSASDPRRRRRSDPPAPLMFGSSLSAITAEPSASSCDWFSTSVPLSMHRRQRHLELDDRGAARRSERQVAHVQHARAARTAGGVRVARVGACRHRHDRERARLEGRVGVQAIDLVAHRESR